LRSGSSGTPSFRIDSTVTASIDFFETPQDISERPLMPGLSRYRHDLFDLG
jgi:hypothetical protein